MVVTKTGDGSSQICAGVAKPSKVFLRISGVDGMTRTGAHLHQCCVESTAGSL